MKRKIAAILITALAATTVLGGCGKSKEGGTTADGKTKIRFATWDNAEDLDAQQTLVDQYNESQDKVEVTLEGYGSEYDTKISAGIGSKDAPDVMYMWNYPTYYEALAPLDELIEKEGDEWKGNYYETLWQYNQMQDKTYGIPVGFTTHALFYNKDIFAKAGIPEPTDDWTWDDLQEAAKTISEKVDGVKGFSYPMKPDPYDFEMYLWSNGTAFCDKEGNLEGNLNSPETAEVFTMFQNMSKDGYAVATEKSGTDEFRGGQTAMYVYGAWALNSLDDDGMNYGVVSIPAFEGAGHDSVSILSTSGLSISKDSKNVDAAWDFIKFWTGEAGNKARIGYELPGLKTVVESEKILENPSNAAFYTMLEQSNGFTPASFLVEGWSQLSETLSLSFEEVFNPSTQMDPKVVLDAAME